MMISTSLVVGLCVVCSNSS